MNGHVKDLQSSLEGATVSLAGVTHVTNYKGIFSFKVRPGIYILSVTHTGYKKFEQEINLREDDTHSVAIQLVKEDGLAEVLVLGSRSSIQRSTKND